jgi:integrase
MQKNDLIVQNNAFPDLSLIAEKLPKLSEESRKTYSYAMNSFKHYCEKNSVPIGIDSLVEWIQSMENGNTQKCYLAAIKKVMRQLFKFDPRLQNILSSLEEIHPEKKDMTITRSKYLTKEEIYQLIHKSPKNLSAIIEVMFWTGFRVSSILNIELEKCTFVESGYYEIRVKGKRNKENTGFIDKKLYDKCKKLFNGKKFLFEHKEKKFTREYISRSITTLGRKILDKKISAHTTRRSFACYLLYERGITLDKVQKAMNHSSINTTAIYLSGKATPEEIGIPGLKKTRKNKPAC